MLLEFSLEGEVLSLFNFHTAGAGFQLRLEVEDLYTTSMTSTNSSSLLSEPHIFQVVFIALAKVLAGAS